VEKNAMVLGKKKTTLGVFWSTKKEAGMHIKVCFNKKAGASGVKPLEKPKEQFEDTIRGQRQNSLIFFNRHKCARHGRLCGN